METYRNSLSAPEPGLCILQYHHGDLDAYNVSYYRRRANSERAFHLCNLRKSHRFRLVAQGADLKVEQRAN